MTNKIVMSNNLNLSNIITLTEISIYIIYLSRATEPRLTIQEISLTIQGQ